ncbi:CoA-binding protein [Pandoraea terrigena]|uniref:CoA-binding protein n=2 Tax=Pandoraea terrigena TaxID=2508292 RepID=A0A5E4VX41_9BURK|nr:CoA-binding protein [Pandoraea terrigena]
MIPSTTAPALSGRIRMDTMERLGQILARDRVIGVVGLSPRPDRPSHTTSRYMQQHGYRIVPINPEAADAGATILGEPVYASLTEAADALRTEGLRIQMVDCFRRSGDIPPIADEAVAIGANSLWMQLGIENDDAAAVALAAGLDVVMDRCVKIEHQRWQMQGGHPRASVDAPPLRAPLPKR